MHPLVHGPVDGQTSHRGNIMCITLSVATVSCPVCGVLTFLTLSMNYVLNVCTYQIILISYSLLETMNKRVNSQWDLEYRETDEAFRQYRRDSHQAKR